MLYSFPGAVGSLPAGAVPKRKCSDLSCWIQPWGCIPQRHTFSGLEACGGKQMRKRERTQGSLSACCAHMAFGSHIDTHRLSIILNIYGHDTLPFPMFLSMILSNGGEGTHGRSFSVILPLSHWHSSSPAIKSQTEGPFATSIVLIFFTPSSLSLL